MNPLAFAGEVPQRVELDPSVEVPSVTATKLARGYANNVHPVSGNSHEYGQCFGCKLNPAYSACVYIMLAIAIRTRNVTQTSCLEWGRKGACDPCVKAGHKKPFSHTFENIECESQPGQMALRILTVRCINEVCGAVAHLCPRMKRLLREKQRYIRQLGLLS